MVQIMSFRLALGTGDTGATASLAGTARGNAAAVPTWKPLLRGRSLVRNGVEALRRCGDWMGLGSGDLRLIGVPPPQGTSDFAAWFEVFLTGHWHTFDACRNAPRT